MLTCEEKDTCHLSQSNDSNVRFCVTSLLRLNFAVFIDASNTLKKFHTLGRGLRFFRDVGIDLVVSLVLGSEVGIDAKRNSDLKESVRIYNCV